MVSDLSIFEVSNFYSLPPSAESSVSSAVGFVFTHFTAEDEERPSQEEKLELGYLLEIYTSYSASEKAQASSYGYLLRITLRLGADNH